jgi:hypothetical protein
VNESENYSIRLLKQKQFINGICYSLQEIYGIDKKSPQNTDVNSEISIQNSKTSNSISNTSSRRNSEKEVSFSFLVKLFYSLLF